MSRLGRLLPPALPLATQHPKDLPNVAPLKVLLNHHRALELLAEEMNETVVSLGAAVAFIALKKITYFCIATTRKT